MDGGFEASSQHSILILKVLDQVLCYDAYPQGLGDASIIDLQQVSRLIEGIMVLPPFDPIHMMDSHLQRQLRCSPLKIINFVTSGVTRFLGLLKWRRLSFLLLFIHLR